MLEKLSRIVKSVRKARIAILDYVRLFSLSLMDYERRMYYSKAHCSRAATKIGSTDRRRDVWNNPAGLFKSLLNRSDSEET